MRAFYYTHRNTQTHTPTTPGKTFLVCLMRQQKRKQVEIAGSILDANISDCYFILYYTAYNILFNI